MAAIPYTRKVFIQRIRKHVSDSRQTNDAFTASDNEILLLIDQATATRIVGHAYESAKIEGALVVAEAYLITYNIGTLSYDRATREWYGALPQPPLSLPLGYSVTRAYLTDGAGASADVNFIRTKRVGFRRYMPYPSGMSCRIENSTIRLSGNNGESLRGYTLYAQMPSARTTDVDAVMNIPEDDISFVFDNVVKELLQRYSIPQDVVADDLPAGNKSS